MHHNDGHGPDEDLVDRCQRGDFTAFEVLYRRYQRPILAYLFQITRDYESSACIAQDVFLKVFEHVGSFDRQRRFTTWFYTIARNAAIDHLHSRNRRPIVNFSDIEHDSNRDGDPLAMLDTAAPGLAIEASLAKAESTDLIRQALKELPQIYREIIELVIFQEHSYEEAAAILSIDSPGTLRSRMFHALRKLRTRLEQLGGRGAQDLT